MSKGLNEMAVECHQLAVEKGWWEPQCTHEYTREDQQYDFIWCVDCGACKPDGEDEWWVPEKAKERNQGELHMLLVTEIAESFEEVRDGKDPNLSYYKSGDGWIEAKFFQEASPEEARRRKPEGVPIELADLLIRLLDYCGHHRIDLEAAYEMKMGYNKVREYRHGGKKA